MRFLPFLLKVIGKKGRNLVKELCWGVGPVVQRSRTLRPTEVCRRSSRHWRP